MFCRRRILDLITKNVQSCRCLFTDESLGLVSFDVFRNQRRNSLVSKEELWRRLGQKYDLVNTEHQRPRLIFSDDLFQAVALAESRDDVQQLYGLIGSFVEERYEGGKYRFLKPTVATFAPLLMKLCHRMRHPDLAFTALTSSDNKFEELFGSNLQCYQIGMDLFYEVGQYQRVLDVYDLYEKRRNSGTKSYDALPMFPKSLQVLVLASCYKMNTPESFQYALKYVGSGYERNSTPTDDRTVSFTRKSLALVSALALNQNEMELSYEILSLIGHDIVDSYTAPRTLKCILLTKLKRWPELMALFKRILESDVPSVSYQDREISMDAIKTVETTIPSINDQAMKEKLKRSCQFLRRGGHVIETNLDSLLCAPVQILPSTRTDDQAFSILDQPSGSRAIAPPMSAIPAKLTSGELKKEQESSMWETSSVYDDDSSALASLEKFQESERKLKKFRKRRDVILKSVGKWIREEGPLEVDNDRGAR